MAKIEAIASQRYRSFMAAMEDDARLRAEVMSTWQALSSYEPRPTDASILFLRARAGQPGRRARRQCLDGPRARRVCAPGDAWQPFHDDGSSHVAHVARAIQQRIAGAVRPRSSTRWRGGRSGGRGQAAQRRERAESGPPSLQAGSSAVGSSLASAGDLAEPPGWVVRRPPMRRPRRSPTRDASGVRPPRPGPGGGDYRGVGRIYRGRLDRRACGEADPETFRERRAI